MNLQKILKLNLLGGKMEELLLGTTELYKDFLAFSKANPLVAGMVGLWGLGVFTFFIRSIPLRIFDFIKRQLTTTLVLNSHDEIFYEFLAWTSENNMHSFVRNLNFNNSARWGNGLPMITVGYGNTMFMFQKCLFWMNRNKEQANQTADAKEVITLTLLGRDKDKFNILFELIKARQDKKNDGYLKIFKWYPEYDRWRLASCQYKRALDTVIIGEDTKEALLNHIETFKKEKAWYRDNGIPYRTGIILEGPPGTGKTSLVKALCCHLQKDLYLIDFSSVTNKVLEQCLTDLPEGSIVVIEDIDTANLENRGSKMLEDGSEEKEVLEASVPLTSKKDSLSSMFGLLSLGGVLNAFDGITSAEDRILIATSNCAKDLDPALLREGRFDLKLKIGYMTDETLKQYLSRFYPEYTAYSNWKIKRGIAPCKVQKLVFDNRDDPEEVLRQICDQ